jgi:hypothetical protein
VAAGVGLTPAAATGVPDPCAAVSASLVVTVLSGTASPQQQTFSGATLCADADLGTVTYTLKSQPSTPPAPYPLPNVLSLHGLLNNLVGVDPSQVHFTTIVVRGGSHVAVLQTADLGLPGDPGYPFLGGLQPAISAQQDGLTYIRPQRSEDDVNAPDRLLTAQTGELDLTVHLTGQLLHPTITANPTSTLVSKPVRFATQPVDGATYTWTFDYGGVQTTKTTATPDVTNRFAQPGTYGASVAVTRSSDGSWGQSSNVALVNVHKPKPPPPPKHHHKHHKKPGPGGGTGNTHHPRTGPHQSNKHHHPQPGPTTHHTPRSGSHPSNGHHGPQPGPTRQPTSGPAPRPGPGSHASRSGSADGRGGHHSRVDQPAPGRSATTTPRQPGGANLVAGTLIANAAAFVPLPNRDRPATPPGVAPLSARAASPAVTPASLAWLGPAVLVVLLLAGAVAEVRRPRLRRSRRIVS